MKIDITKKDTKIEITITGSDECIVNIKANNCTVITETENKIEEPQYYTGNIPLVKLYDANPELFLEVYDKYMNHELRAREAAKILDCSISTFNNMLKYYRDKENLHEKKYHVNNKNLAKYDIYDKKPEEFLEVYNKFMNKKIYSKEAARLLSMSISTFYRSIEYYESKTGIENFG